MTASKRLKSCSSSHLLASPIQTWMPNPNDSGGGCLTFFDIPFHGPRAHLASLKYPSARTFTPTAGCRRGEALGHFSETLTYLVVGYAVAHRFRWPLLSYSHSPRVFPPTEKISLSVVPGLLFHSSSLLCAISPLVVSYPFRWRRYA